MKRYAVILIVILAVLCFTACNEQISFFKNPIPGSDISENTSSGSDKVNNNSTANTETEANTSSGNATTKDNTSDVEKNVSDLENQIEDLKNQVESLENQVANNENTTSAKNAFYNTVSEITAYEETCYDNIIAQADMNRVSGIVYEKWDTLLNDVYRYLKRTLPDAQFRQLEADELNWIEIKSDAIEHAAAEVRGGSMEPLVRNQTAASYTKDRCLYLISLIQ